MSDDDLAACASAVLGRPITHTRVPVAAAREAMSKNGYSRWRVDGLTELFAFYEARRGTALSPDVERVLGRPARRIDDVVWDHRAAFGG